MRPACSPLLPDSRQAAITVLEDTQPPLQALFFSGRGRVRAPWGDRCGLGPPQAHEAPGEGAAPGPRASPPPGPPQAHRGTGCPSLAQDPPSGPGRGPGRPRSLLGLWHLGTDRAAVASISLPRHHPSRPTPCPPAQRAVPAPTFLLLAGGHELGCHEQPDELVVLLRRLDRAGVPDPVSQSTDSQPVRSRRPVLGQGPCRTPPVGGPWRRLGGLARAEVSRARGLRTGLLPSACRLGRPAGVSLAGARELGGLKGQNPWVGRRGATQTPRPALCSVGQLSGAPVAPLPKAGHDPRFHQGPRGDGKDCQGHSLCVLLSPDFAFGLDADLGE